MVGMSVKLCKGSFQGKINCVLTKVFLELEILFAKMTDGILFCGKRKEVKVYKI